MLCFNKTVFKLVFFVIACHALGAHAASQEPKEEVIPGRNNSPVEVAKESDNVQPFGSSETDSKSITLNQQSTSESSNTPKQTDSINTNEDNPAKIPEIRGLFGIPDPLELAKPFPLNLADIFLNFIDPLDLHEIFDPLNPGNPIYIPIYLLLLLMLIDPLRPLKTIIMSILTFNLSKFLLNETLKVLQPLFQKLKKTINLLMKKISITLQPVTKTLKSVVGTLKSTLEKVSKTVEGTVETASKPVKLLLRPLSTALDIAPKLPIKILELFSKPPKKEEIIREKYSNPIEAPEKEMLIDKEPKPTGLIEKATTLDVQLLTRIVSIVQHIESHINGFIGEWLYRWRSQLGGEVNNGG